MECGESSAFTNYLAKFLINLSTISEPLRRLIRKDVEFQWGHTQEDAFRKIKEVATSEQSTVRSGWPENKQMLLPGLKPYWTFREEMSADDGILYTAFIGERMVIPKSCQKDLLERIEATLRRARDSIYWPGLTSDIKQMVESCQACSKEKPSQEKETLRSHDILSKP